MQRYSFSSFSEAIMLSRKCSSFIKMGITLSFSAQNCLFFSTPISTGAILSYPVLQEFLSVVPTIVLPFSVQSAN